MDPASPEGTREGELQEGANPVSTPVAPWTPGEPMVYSPPGMRAPQGLEGTADTTPVLPGGGLGAFPIGGPQNVFKSVSHGSGAGLLRTPPPKVRGTQQ